MLIPLLHINLKLPCFLAFLMILPLNLHMQNASIPQLLHFTCQYSLRSLIIAQILPQLNSCQTNDVGWIWYILSKHGHMEHIIHPGVTQKKSNLYATGPMRCRISNSPTNYGLSLFHKPNRLIPLDGDTLSKTCSPTLNYRSHHR